MSRSGITSGGALQRSEVLPHLRSYGLTPPGRVFGGSRKLNPRSTALSGHNYLLVTLAEHETSLLLTAKCEMYTDYRISGSSSGRSKKIIASLPNVSEAEAKVVV